MDETIGDRVRALRLARGLTQADLAGSDLHGSYISLIEAGKRVPTSSVVTLLATRLNCSAEFLATGADALATATARLDLRRAEIALACGQGNVALAEFANLAKRFGTDHEAGRRRILGHAHALELANRPAEALALTRIESDDPRIDDSVPMAIVRCRCLRALGQLDSCIDAAKELHSRLVDELGVRRGPEVLEVVSVLSDAYIDLGQIGRARDILSDQLPELDEAPIPTGRRAELDSFRRAIGLAAAQERFGEALRLADHALEVANEISYVRQMSRLRLRYAFIALRSPEPDLWWLINDLHRAHNVFLTTGSPSDIAACLIELALAQVLLDQPAEAIAQAGRAMTALDAAFGQPSVESVRALAVLGQAHLRMGERQAALASYRMAAHQLAIVDPSPDTVRAWHELSGLLRSAGAIDEAAMVGGLARPRGIPEYR